jgi:hypothetical protein
MVAIADLLAGRIRYCGVDDGEDAAFDEDIPGRERGIIQAPRSSEE